jgi:geranylgeranyl pyrophosphate synthase
VGHRRRRLRSLLDPDVLGVDLIDAVRHLDGALSDLAGGSGAPPGFDPRRFLAPGVPRIRPVLVLLSARAAEPEGHEPPRRFSDASTEQLAVAAELLHVAIVLHDAALGRQGGRRRRAARRIISGAVGVLGGNHLTLRALELARTSEAPEIVGDLLDAMREISEGHALAQQLDGGTPAPDDVLGVADGHSGAVFSFACRAGARLAGADRPVVTALGRYGRHAGIAWHIAEDLAALDLDGEDPVGSVEDRAGDRRPSFTVSVACARDPGLGEAWHRLAQRPDLGLAQEVVARIEASGAPTAGREALAQEAWAARRSLMTIRPSPHRDALDRLVMGMAK